MASHSWRCSCLILLDVGILDICYHAWLILYILKVFTFYILIKTNNFEVRLLEHEFNSIIKHKNHLSRVFTNLLWRKVHMKNGKGNVFEINMLLLNIIYISKQYICFDCFFSSLYKNCTFKS